MKLPWDKRFIQICFHVIVTFLILYTIKVTFDLVALSFEKFDVFTESVKFFLDIIKSFSALFFGVIIAFIFDPVVEFFQQFYLNHKRKPPKKVTRNFGTFVLYFGFILILAFIALIIFIKVITVSADTQGFEDTINELKNIYYILLDKLKEVGLFDKILEFIPTVISEITQSFYSFSSALFSKINEISVNIINFALGFILAYYLLVDKHNILAFFSSIVSIFKCKKNFDNVNSTYKDTLNIFSTYLRGQILDAIIIGILMSTFLTIVNVPFSILIGVFAGFANMIPYFGAIIGTILATLMAFLSGGFFKAFYVLAGMTLIQQLDQLIISPKIVGKKLNLSPLSVILSILVGGQLFGLVGMFFAVPVFAITKLFVVKLINKYS